jgi:hypothetical protein
MATMAIVRALSMSDETAAFADTFVKPTLVLLTIAHPYAYLVHNNAHC